VASKDDPLNPKFTLENDPIFVSGYLRAEFVEDIHSVMHEQGMDSCRLAEKLGMTLFRADNILGETEVLTIDLAAEIACKLGMRVSLRMLPRNERMIIKKDSHG